MAATRYSKKASKIAGIAVAEAALIVALLAVVALAVLSDTGTKVCRMMVQVTVPFLEGTSRSLRCGCGGTAGRYSCNQDPETMEISCACTNRL